jgi:tRNA (adenine37-N6)-methyltransferase
MVRENEIRSSERADNLPPTNDVDLVFIGRISSPWTSRLLTRQGVWTVCFAASKFLNHGCLHSMASRAIHLSRSWLHLSRRDLILQSPANDGISRGTLSLRSPVQPNPIGTEVVLLVGNDHAYDSNFEIAALVVLVRGLALHCWTSKPDRTLFTPTAQAGDFEIGDL